MYNNVPPPIYSKNHIVTWKFLSHLINIFLVNLMGWGGGDLNFIILSLRKREINKKNIG